MTDRPDHPDRDLDLPARLAEDLARLQRTPAVPPQVDMAILASAHLRMRRGASYRRTIRWAGGAVAAVAAILAVAVYLAPMSPRPADRVSVAAAQPTILDAFNLARRLEQGPVRDSRFDVNGDGRVDRGDVDALAMAAVRLKGERA